MSTAPQALHAPWGDRIELIPKRMGYVLSLDLSAEASGPYLQIAPSNNALRHLFGDQVVTMPEGLRCDLPVAKIEAGTGEIGRPEDLSSTSLQMRVTARLGSADVLLIESLGVINFSGGLAAFRATSTDKAKTLAGSAFIATRHETASATYRWLNRRQLFGFGRVKGSRAQSGNWELAFSFDLYAGA